MNLNAPKEADSMAYHFKNACLMKEILFIKPDKKYYNLNMERAQGYIEDMLFPMQAYTNSSLPSLVNKATHEFKIKMDTLNINCL